MFSVIIQSKSELIWTFDILETNLGIATAGMVSESSWFQLIIADRSSKFGIGTSLSMSYTNPTDMVTVNLPLCLYYFTSIKEVVIYKSATVINSDGEQVIGQIPYMRLRPTYIYFKYSSDGKQRYNSTAIELGIGYRFSTLFSVNGGYLYLSRDAFTDENGKNIKSINWNGLFLMLRLHLGWQWKRL